MSGLLSLLNIPGLMNHSLASSLLGGLGTVFLARDQQLKEDQARADNIALGRGVTGLYGATGNEKMPQTQSVGPLGDVSLPYNAVQDLLNYQADIGGKMRGQHTDSENRLRDFMNRQLSGYDQDSATVQRDYREGLAPTLQATRDRYARGMKILEGAGEQTRKDINTSYDANAGSIEADLASRGLDNSTIRSNLLQGNLRERRDTLGRLDESLRGQRLETDANLSGDVINAERSAAIGSNALLQSRTSGRQSLAGSLGGALLDKQDANTQQRVSFDSSIGTQRQNLGNNANQGIINFLGGVSMPYPDASNLNAINNFWSGQGAFKGTTDAMNIQDKQFEQQLTMSALSAGLSPISSFAGAFGGGAGFNLANKAFGGGSGGGGYGAGSAFAASGNGPMMYQLR